MTSLIRHNLDYDIFDQTEFRFKLISVLQTNLNESDGAWQSLAKEVDPAIISLVMWEWLDQLKVSSHQYFKKGYDNQNNLCEFTVPLHFFTLASYY